MSSSIPLPPFPPSFLLTLRILSLLATYLIDYLLGDPIPPSALNPETEPKFDLMAWIGKHTAAETQPQVDNVIKGLKAEGVTTFAATGYCTIFSLPSSFFYAAY